MHGAVVSMRFSTANIHAAILGEKENKLLGLMSYSANIEFKCAKCLNVFSQFEQLSFLPPNMPTNLVLQFYNLGTVPGNTKTLKSDLSFKLKTIRI